MSNQSPCDNDTRNIEGLCVDGRRNNYFFNKRLTVDSFRVEQHYQIARRRLLNRAIHGWGIVFGFAMTEVKDASVLSARFEIGKGLALDKCGRELLEPGSCLSLDDLIILDKAGQVVVPEHRKDFFAHQMRQEGCCWLLSAHYAESLHGPVSVDTAHGEACEWEHVCETVAYSLRPVAIKQCYEVDADCGDSDDSTSCDPGQSGNDLCETLTNLHPGGDECCLTEVKLCNLLRVDLRNGVPIACIRPADGKVDICSPRRFVKRNDLLYDLIPREDLATRICEIGWAEWHRREEAIRFKSFRKAFKAEDAMASPDEDPDETNPALKTPGFWVRFSRPVQRRTLRADCFVMTVLSIDDAGLRPLRAPISGLHHLDENGQTTDADLVYGAEILFDSAWLNASVYKKWSLFRGSPESPAIIEIEIRADFILDCNGRPVDGNAVGLSPGPTGNGIPGGSFLSTFKVAT